MSFYAFQASRILLNVMEKSPCPDSSYRTPATRFLIFAASFLATVALGFWHIPKFDPDELFFLSKYEKDSNYDIVLIGDSRVFVSLNPDAFETTIPGSKCLNFGFSGLGYSDAYFEKVDRIIAPTSQRRLIVLGIDAGTLTTLSAENNAFTVIDRMKPIERLQLRLLGPLWLARDPISRPHRFVANGWVPVAGIPFNPHESIDMFANRFDTARCSDDILVKIASQIRLWRSHGIQILALRMPTSEDMFRLECNLIGYRPEHVKSILKEAGATWLDLPDADPDCYDGSHLGLKSSRRVTAQIAQAAAGLIGR